MKGLALGFAAFLLVIVGLADQGALPELLKRIHDLPGGDKLGHFGLMGTMALLADLAFRGRWRGLPAGSVTVLVIVTLEELSQLWFPQRSFSLSDLAADYAGIVCGAWLAGRLTGKAANRKLATHPDSEQA